MALLGACFVAGCSVPDDMLRAMAYGEIADARFRAGDPAGARDAALMAVEVADAAEPGDEGAFANLAASVALLRAGYPGEALRRAEALPDAKERLLPLAGLARALATDGFDREASYAAARVYEIAAAVPDGEGAENAAMALLSRSAIGDFAGLLSQAAKNSDKDVRNGLLAIIAEDLAASGDFAGGLSAAALISDGPETDESDFYLGGRLLQAVGDDSIGVARELLFDPRVPMRIVALNRIALEQARQADFAGASDTLASALDHAEAHYEGVLRAQALIATAMTAAVVGNEAPALEVLSRADSILSGPAGEGKWERDQARTIALAMRDAIENGKAAAAAVGSADFAGDPNELLVMKAVALIRLSRTSAAAETLDFAARNTTRDSDLSATAIGYAILADRQAVLGDQGGAERWARRALSLADRLSPTSEDRMVALYFGTVALVRAGLTDLAWETAPRIELQRPEPAQ